MFLDAPTSMGNADIRRLGSSSYFCGKEAAKRGMHRALSLAPNRSPCRLQKQHRETSNKQTTSRAELKWIHPCRLGGVDSSMQSVRMETRVVLAAAGGAVSSLSSRSPGDALDATLFSTSRNPSENLSVFPPSNMGANLSPPAQSVAAYPMVSYLETAMERQRVFIMYLGYEPTGPVN